jgi:hypothetical protein
MHLTSGKFHRLEKMNFFASWRDYTVTGRTARNKSTPFAGREGKLLLLQ